MTPFLMRPITIVASLFASLILCFFNVLPAFGQEETFEICPSGCRYTNIQQAINAVSAPTTLHIGPGTYRENITLRAGISLVGAGTANTIISGNGSQSVVTISASSITRTTLLEEITISNGGGASGGGISIRNGAAPTLRNLVISNNRTTGAGGGIAIIDTSNPLLERVTISNNTSPNGAALVVTSRSRTEIRDSLIENNVTDDLSVTGALYVLGASELVLINTTIRNTSGRFGSGLALGGSTASITDSLFENNQSEGVGGGINAWSASLIIIERTQFINNRGLYGGGLVLDQSTATIKNSLFQDNVALQAGGGIEIHENSQLLLDNTRFLRNRANAQSGGAITSNACPITIQNSVIDGNQAPMGAGIQFTASPNAVVTNSSIINNYASMDGAGLTAYGGNLRIEGSTFANNTAQRFGGGVVMQNDANVAITGNNIHHNTSDSDGAGVTFQINVTGSFTRNTVSFNQVSSGVAGGAKIFSDASLLISDNVFEGNVADDGAAIQIEERSHPTVMKNTFRNNLARHYGGAVVVNIYSNPTIVENSFHGNRADINGGAIVLNEFSAATVARNSITGNTASVGAGILAMKDNSRIQNNYIAQNTATASGAGIYLDNSTTQITGNQITDNQAAQFGGGLITVNSRSPVINNLILRNRASIGGAGVTIKGSSPTLQNNTIAENGQNQNTDGIFLFDGATPTLKYNIIANNDYGLRSSNGQPASSAQNLLFNNRLGNYANVTPGSSDLQVNPQFVPGPLSAYYLAHTATGQTTNSPAVDTASETAQALGLHVVSTRRDGVGDSGRADLGYHHPVYRVRTYLPYVNTSR